MKRSEFEHEREVRLIYVEEREIEHEKLIRVPFDPNVVFDEITFDPRLLEFERREREALFKDKGYTGTFTKSDLYLGMFLDVGVDISSESDRTYTNPWDAQ